jgi:hypothetical protein
MAKTKKPRQLEYRMLITPEFNERGQRYTTLVLLETTRLFASFRYDLSVRESLHGKTIHYKILGLKAPPLSLPASGHARFVREYDDLRGRYEITVEGLDGNVNSFEVRISPKKVTLTKTPDTKFIDVVVDKSLWTSNSLSAKP